MGQRWRRLWGGEPPSRNPAPKGSEGRGDAERDGTGREVLKGGGAAPHSGGSP